MRYSGADYGLRAAGYEAAVTEVGGRLRLLTYQGRPLVEPFGTGELAPFYRGAVLAPWPNRIGAGRYEFGGAEHQLPVTEVARNAALHGLVAWAGWQAQVKTETEVTLGCRIWPQSGYPFLVDLRVSYALAADGLTITLTATNGGDRAAPYGCSIHPYLVAGPGPVDGWSLRLPAATFLEVDPVSMLPVREVGVAAGDLDFRDGQLIGERRIDHAFGGLSPVRDGGGAAAVLGPDGHGVELTWDDSSRWVQVFTTDFADPAADRAALAIEPMTCPPNAFASGTDVISLEPGRTARSSWRIRAI